VILSQARGPAYLQFLKARFMPDDAASILFGLSNEARLAIGLDRAESLMCRLQIVPPPIIRPSNFVGESKVRSEIMTCALQDVVRANLELCTTIDLPKVSSEDLERAYDKLQVMVSGIVNHAIKRSAAQSGLLPLVAATSKRKIIDLKTRLNGKKARVRGNLNGKRVDQSGRTVISGDSSHDIDELGVPGVMMNKLTFPEQVTSHNMARLSKAILVGAYADNGALAVRPPSHSLDHVIWLPILDYESRIDLAAQLKPGWTVRDTL
jgi:DNA-directed RNA polymerase beta' subunit